LSKKIAISTGAKNKAAKNIIEITDWSDSSQFANSFAWHWERHRERGSWKMSGIKTEILDQLIESFRR